MIELKSVTKIFPDSASASVDDVSLKVNQGNICVLLGPSRCGKTTILRTINRLEEPSSGNILINSENIRKADPSVLRRSIGYVIQQTGLLPHRTVGQNIALVPNLLGWPQQKINNRVDELLELILAGTIYIGIMAVLMERLLTLLEWYLSPDHLK